MTQLTATQHALISAALEQPNRCLLPLPERLKGGAVQKVVGALLARGLIEEVEGGSDALVWRDTCDGHALTLVATDTAVAALAHDADSTPPPEGRCRHPSRGRPST